MVLTPQNQKFLGSYLDKPSFERNRKVLAAFMKSYIRQEITYRDWADRYPSPFFLDHCHLTPEGNRQYADDLALFLRGNALNEEQKTHPNSFRLSTFVL